MATKNTKHRRNKFKIFVLSFFWLAVLGYAVYYAPRFLASSYLALTGKDTVGQIIGKADIQPVHGRYSCATADLTVSVTSPVNQNVLIDNVCDKSSYQVGNSIHVVVSQDGSKANIGSRTALLVSFGIGAGIILLLLFFFVKPVIKNKKD